MAGDELTSLRVHSLLGGAGVAAEGGAAGSRDFRLAAKPDRYSGVQIG
jgi:hypothetical protein